MFADPLVMTRCGPVYPGQPDTASPLSFGNLGFFAVAPGRGDGSAGGFPFAAGGADCYQRAEAGPPDGPTQGRVRFRTVATLNPDRLSSEDLLR